MSGAIVDVFEDRYGSGAHARLVALLRQPCITFARIAAQFGVSRERVRQWHARVLPDAPLGRERRRRCGIANQKRRLLSDPLFRAFYRHARPFFSRERLVLIPSRDGFRKRELTLDTSLVVLKAARQAATRREDGARSYLLAGHRRSTGFVYFQMTDADFVFVPAAAVPAGGTSFVDTDASKYHMFKNNFRALLDAPLPRPQDAQAATCAAGGCR